MTFALVEESEFFAPVSHDMIDGLVSQYEATRQKIKQVSAIVRGDDYKGVMHYFIDGNADRSRYTLEAERLFKEEGAIAALNSAYWSKTLGLTDVLDCMPQKRRDEWNKSITERTAPDFTEDTVRATLRDLLSMRHQFLAERVDGIFRALSREHVTNAPEGFRKRMILGYVTSNYHSSNSQSGVINDLRAVIAKFMGRDEPKWNSSKVLVSAALRNRGQWMNVDGGAMRIRVYLKGTAHLEIHPDMAYRLNQILAHLYPMAIPSEFRTKPKAKHKEFQMMGRPLPFAVIDIISCLRKDRHGGGHRYTLDYYSGGGTPARKEALRVLESIGGVITGEKVEFDYDPQEAIDEILASGCIPDRVAHQYYPTPESVAAIAVGMADIADGNSVLEPSAGQGNLASLLPNPVCVEISKLHCDILKAKGFNVTQADFIDWAAEKLQTPNRFDRIVMNPPFSEGRAKAHVEAAASLLKQDGVIVAILPASFKGKDVLPGFKLEWSPVLENEFQGTSVSVVIMKGER